MVDQSKSEFFAALVKQIKDNVPDLKSVYDDVKHTSELAASDFPCCLVVEGGDVSRHNVTSTQDQAMNVFIRILADSDTSVDEFRDLDEAIIGAINSDSTVDGTCLHCHSENRDAPMLWEDTNKYATRRYLVIYRRDR